MSGSFESCCCRSDKTNRILLLVTAVLRNTEDNMPTYVLEVKGFPAAAAAAGRCQALGPRGLFLGYINNVDYVSVQ